MSPPSFYQLRFWALSSVLIVAGIILLLLPFLAVHWIRTPFPGFFLDPNLVVNDVGRFDSWESQQLDPPIRYPERVVAVNDVVIETQAEWETLMHQQKVGEVGLVQLEMPAQPYLFTASPIGIASRRAVELPFIKLSLGQLWQRFGITYLTGVSIFAMGVWVFRRRPTTPEAQLFALTTVLMGLGIALWFDYLTDHYFLRIWIVCFSMGGALLFLLSLVFPQQNRLIRRYPRLRWVILMPAFLITLFGQYTLYSQTAPWDYVLAWRWAFLVDGLYLTASIALVGYRAFRAASPLVRQQARIILLGAVAGFLPIIVYFFLSTPFMPISLTGYRAELYLPPLVLYPLAVGYLIIRYRLLDINVVAQRAVTYGLLTLVPALLYAGIIALLTTILGPIAAADNPILLTLFITILFVILNPLRAWLQEIVSRTLIRTPQYDNLLRECNRQLANTVQVNKVVDTFIQFATAGVPHTKARLYLTDTHESRYICVTNDGPSFDLQSPLVRFLQREPGSLYLADERTLPESLRAQQAEIVSLNAAVVVPLLSSQHLLGWLTLSPKTTNQAYEPAELSYLNALVDQSRLGLERANVIRNLEERVEEFRLLSQFSQALNYTVVFDDLLELISIHCQWMLRVRDVRIYWRFVDSPLLKTVMVVQNDIRLPAQEGFACTDDLILNVLHTGQMSNHTDPEQGQHWLIAPFSAGAESIGVLQIGQNHPFHERQRQVFSILVDRAATAMDRWRANDRLAARAQHLAILNEVTSSLNASLDVNHLLELILTKSITLLEAEAGSLLVVDADTGELVFHASKGAAGQDLIGKRVPAGSGIVGQIVRTGQPLKVDDVRQNANWFSEVDERSAYVTRAVLGVPLLRGNDVMGVLEILNKRNGSNFTEEDQTLLTAFAGQAVIAFENTRLLQQTDAELQKRVNELSLLQRLDLDLNTTLDVQAVLDATLTWTLRVFGASAGAILLVGDAGTMTNYSTYGYDPSFDLQTLSLQPDKIGLIGEVLQKGQPHLTEDVHKEDHYIPAAFDTRSQMTIPIIHKQKTIGAVAIESRQPYIFTPDDLGRAERLINHATIAIANALLYDQVRATNQAKSQFVSEVSHELKTPITVIQGYAEWMLHISNNLDATQINYLERIVTNSHFMVTLIRDLADISRLETGSMSVSLVPLALESVIEQALDTVQSLFDKKEITLIVDMPAELPRVWGDEQRLVQVLTNLLSNACKYSSVNTDVHLSGYLENGFVNCQVTDNGYGISPEDQTKLFTKYFRANAPHVQDVAGTGLGLSIAKGIIELHGGQISCQSQLGKGTSFTFSLQPYLE